MKRRIVTPLLLGLALLFSLAAAGDGGARDIASGTITGDRIAASTITADKLTVSTLSAITANLGTVTAGEIDGVTVKAGSSDEVLINSSGISITSGTNGTNYYKFDGTTRGMRYSTGGTVDLRGANGVVLISDAGSDAGWDGSAWFPLADDNDDLGKSGQRWRDLYVSRDVYVSTLAGLGTSRFVCHDNSGKLYDSAGTCDGSAPAPSPAEVATLRQEIAELRAQVAELLAAVQSR